MLSYELCKKLKDAGFPQPKKGSQIEHMKDIVWTPTLSELIEACGDEFINLTKTKINWAVNFDGKHDGFGTADASGETPEEAVAHLYLELNMKK